MQQSEYEKNAILVIDDDESAAEVICSFLERCGFDTRAVSNGQEGLQSIGFSAPDLIVCDVIMPEMDGREFLRRLRTKKIQIPVIMLSRVGETHEKVLSLEEGADDYIDKPYDPLELVARIRSVLRRSRQYQPSLSHAWMLTAGDLMMNRQRREVFLQGQLLQLTRRAFLLLEYMLTHPDEILSRERLLEIVWGWENLVDTRAVDTRIGELRKMLKDHADYPIYIETVPQEGYRFIHPVQVSA